MPRLILTLLAAGVLLAACAPADTAAPQEPTLRPATATSPPATPTPTVQPTDPADAYAFARNQRLGRGVNLGNALEAPVEGEWGMVLEAEFFRLIREAGFDSVRVPIRWNAHAEEEAPFAIDPAFFERIDWVIEQSLENDLAVIVNIHHYEEIMENPVWHEERFLAIWRQIAERYREMPEDVFFELLNEPFGTLANTSWNDFAGEAIEVIRQSNPERIIIVGPGNWNAIDTLPVLFLPEDDRRIIATVHYYQPFQFTHQGAEWVADSDPWLGTTWDGTEREEALIDRSMDAALKWSQQNGRPIFLGEFGAYSKADMDSRQRWTAYVARSAEERGFSWAYWEFGAGFGVYDREAKAWVEPLRQALVPGGG